MPMFKLSLFRIRAFAFGNLASLLGSLGRGGVMFMLIILLQGIWLPLHGYSFASTPFWAGIYMIPMTGRDISIIVPFIAAIKTPIVVFESATHLYLTTIL